MTTTRSLWLRLGAALLAAFLGPAAAAAPDYQRGAAPAWTRAVPIDFEARPTQGQPGQGVHYLLVDQQIRLEEEGVTLFRRLVSRAVNERGVESVAHVGIEFDPSWQKLVLHSLKLHRGGRVQDRLATAQVRVLQREPELEYRIYDDRKTVDIVLEDVRVDDVVEYAYSLRGSNPVFGGRAFGRIDMRWRSPVHQLHRRLLAPAGRAVHWRAPTGKSLPQPANRDGWTEWVWWAEDLAGFPRQGETPDWYDPYEAVQWSEFADWAAVARWAEPLYASSAEALKGPLRSEIDRIAAAAPSPEERVREVLLFVQSQIRYLGVEVGPGSHAPRPPAMVLARRYGDCKDKVLLAVAMLHALGVEAHPALVHTRLRQAVAGLLPSPGAFNHVILVARVDGQTYWLDPTRAPQKSRLQRIAQAGFGQALVLDGRATGLTPIELPHDARSRRELAMSIDASAGYGASAGMVVQTTYEGGSAEAMRDNLRDGDLEELQRDYLNFYLRSYPGLSVRQPLVVEDDEAANRLVIVESYRMESFGNAAPASGKPAAVVYVPDMGSPLARPDEAVRTAPLVLDHPADLTVKVAVRLPEPRSIAASSKSVHGKAFSFDQSAEASGGHLRLHYHYRSLADHVAPADLAAHIDQLAAARKLVGYTLGAGGQMPAAPASPQRAWLTLACGLLWFASVGWVLWAAFSVRRVDDTAPISDHRLLVAAHGLFHGGPLSLLLLCLVVGGLSGRLDLARGAGWGTALVMAAIWHVSWHDLWRGWAIRRAAAPEALLRRARRRALPSRPLVPPPVPVEPVNEGPV